MESIKIRFPLWIDVCKALSNESLKKLKQILKRNPSETLMLTFKHQNRETFSQYVDSLDKNTLCEYAAKYYVLTSCRSLRFTL
jgi:hypothetical protein